MSFRTLDFPRVLAGTDTFAGVEGVFKGVFVRSTLEDGISAVWIVRQDEELSRFIPAMIRSRRASAPGPPVRGAT